MSNSRSNRITKLPPFENKYVSVTPKGDVILEGDHDHSFIITRSQAQLIFDFERDIRDGTFDPKTGYVPLGQEQACQLFNYDPDCVYGLSPWDAALGTATITGRLLPASLILPKEKPDSKAKQGDGLTEKQRGLLVHAWFKQAEDEQKKLAFRDKKISERRELKALKRPRDGTSSRNRKGKKRARRDYESDSYSDSDAEEGPVASGSGGGGASGDVVDTEAKEDAVVEEDQAMADGKV